MTSQQRLAEVETKVLDLFARPWYAGKPVDAADVTYDLQDKGYPQGLIIRAIGSLVGKGRLAWDDADTLSLKS